MLGERVGSCWGWETACPAQVESGLEHVLLDVHLGGPQEAAWRWSEAWDGEGQMGRLSCHASPATCGQTRFMMAVCDVYRHMWAVPVHQVACVPPQLASVCVSAYVQVHANIWHVSMCM